MRTFLLLLGLSLAAPAQWTDLFNGKNLDGWEIRGDGLWYVLDGGTLVGQRNPRENPPTTNWPLDQRAYGIWLNTQAWLYTKKEYKEYDLSLEYWTRVAGNSGVSLHDQSRAKHAIVTPPDFTKTPARIAYEIQINNQYPDKTTTGSIYGVAPARTGAQRDNQWNKMDIEVRAATIKVRINGQLVAEADTLPTRPSQGPIGLQLHDQYTLIQFRNIRIREIR